MKIRRMALLCGIGMLGLIQGCRPAPVMPVTIVLGLEDDGTGVNANVDDRLVIVLPDIDGSAYSWQILGYDADVIRFDLGKSVNASGPGAAAQGASEVVVFTVVGVGITAVHLEYRPIGSAAGTGIDTFSVTIGS
jgi:hypothetical protein